jgi:hypothetical protein
VRSNPKAGVDECLDWLCARARKGETLLWWSQFWRQLSKIVQELKEKRADSPFEIALNILAAEFDASLRTLKRIVYPTGANMYETRHK